MKMRRLLFLTLAAILSLTLAIPVMADPGEVEVPTEGEITGGTIPPVIEYKWELPDEDVTVADGVCQIIPPPATMDWTTQPATETEGTNPLVIWAVVSDEEGIGDIMTVYNEVYETGQYPSGPYKWQKVMVEVTDPAEIEASKVAAVASGQLTQAEADEIDAKWLKNDCRIYKYEGVIDTHQPSGTWTVKVYATDKGGSTTTTPLVNTIEVVGILAFALDFDVVDWGPIKPLTTDTVPGDEILDSMDLAAPGTNDNPPTIKNLGNDSFRLKMLYDKMVGTVYKKEIDKFDATFKGVHKATMNAGTWYTWPVDAYLERCHHTQIDFSIHPSAEVTTDTYEGALHITVVAVP
jgi:hypothetical protein